MTTPTDTGYTTTISFGGTAIGLIKGDIPYPEKSRTKMDYYNRDNGNVKETRPGALDMGEISIECILSPSDAGQDAIRAAEAAETIAEVIIADTVAGFTITFNAYVSGIGGVSPIDDAKVFSFKLQPTTDYVWAETASGGLSGLTGIEQEAGGALDFVPNFGAAIYAYNVLVNTASTWVKFTPTAASHTITITCGTQSQTVATGEQSTAITLGAADSQTVITIKAQESGKVAKEYKIYVARP